MNILRTVAAALAFSLALTGAAQAPGRGLNPGARATDASPSAGDRYIVTFKSYGRTSRGIIAALGGSVVRELPSVGAIAARIPAEALAGLRNHPDVKLIEPDAPRYPMALWNDEVLPSGEIIPYGYKMVQADQLSAAGVGNRKLCIIDSGYSRAHEDLQNLNVTASPDSGTGDPFKDDTAHGTHVAGTIAAIGGNGLGVKGVNDTGYLRLHIVKVFGDLDGSWAYSSDLVAALAQCEAAGANIVSMSLGGPSLVTAEQTAFANAEANGILSIAAAGNDGTTDISYPGGYSSVMSVGAVDADEVVAGFSQKNATVEISAPGVRVLSTVPEHAEATVAIGATEYEATTVENAGSSLGVTAVIANGGLCGATNVAWSGKVVLCQRGTFTFAEKVLNVQNSGGIAAIIYNNVTDANEVIFATLDPDYGRIPAVTLTRGQGEDIVANHIGQSTTVVNYTWEQVLNGYDYFDGTSMATPHVSAVAALVWSYYTGWTNQQLRAALTATAKDKGTAGRDDSYGYGIVQAKAAQQYLCTNTGFGCSAPAATPDPDPASACVTDTAQSDFGIQWDGFTSPNALVDLESSPGDARLRDVGTTEAVDQSATSTTLLVGSVFTNTTWVAQTFTAGTSGTLTQADLYLYCDTCSGIDPDITVSIRATAANLPSGPDLATATIDGFNGDGWKRATFSPQLALTSGTKYAIVVRSISARAAGSYTWVSTGTCAANCSYDNPYAGGQLTSSVNSGSTWANVTPHARSGFFRTWMKTGSVAYPSEGYLVSSTKDAGTTADWGALTWNDSTPAGTSVSFHAAASNDPAGPFNFVGPDATSGTFFTNGASLSQFNGMRYLRYRARLATTLPVNTPSLSDVQVCYTIVTQTTLRGTVTDNTTGLPISGATVDIGISSALTNGSGYYEFTGIAPGSYDVNVTASGYAARTIEDVAVPASQITTQNVTLTPTSACLVDTTQSDFQAGTATNVTATSAGQVTLFNTGVEAVDQAQTTSANDEQITSTQWFGQTFQAGTNGRLTAAEIRAFLSSGAAGTIGIELRTVSGGLPTATVLASTSTALSATSATVIKVPFGSPATVTAGTTYALVLKVLTGGTYTISRTNNTQYANGNIVSTTNSGSSWTATANRDLYFRTFVTPIAYASSGTLVSRLRDSGAADGVETKWTTISWTASVPANTTVRFQAAASTSSSGPFNFVGPDGTASTFFTVSGDSLIRFRGKRYLKYKLYLSTTDATVTPSVSDVTVCYTLVTPCTPPATPAATNGGPYCPGNTIQLFTDPVPSAVYDWTGPNGFVSHDQNPTIPSATTSHGGTYSLVIMIDGCFSASGSTSVVVNPTPATPSISGGDSFCTGGSVLLTSSSATGNQWYLDGNPISLATNQTHAATAPGGYTVVVTASNCPSAPSAVKTITEYPIPPTPTITPGGPTTFCPGGSVLLTSSAASGNQWYLDGNPLSGQTGTTHTATLAGSYTVVVTLNGCASPASSPTVVTINPTPSTPVITPGGPTTFCAGGSVLLTSSAGAGNQWYLDGNPIGGETGTTFSATTSGSYTVVVTENGCPSAPSTAVVVTVYPIPATPTITPGGPTTFCAGGSVLLTSSSGTGNQWYLNGNPISGETNSTYNATASGSYTVVVTANGCSSAPSSATVVTVNPIPATPTITPGGPTTFCAGGSVLLTSSASAGNQWYLDGNPLGAATSNTYNATASGSYTVVVTENGCASAPSSATVVTVNPIPPTPAITPGGPTTFCTGGSVLLTSSSATGNQWYLNGNPLGGETNSTYNATASGSYTVVVTANGCSSAPSSATVVTVNPIPATPTITPGGPTTFCAGGSVLLTSSASAGNQWYLDGNPLGGATSNTYNATASGSYTVVVTENGCASAPSSATVVTVNPIPPTPAITPGGPTTFCTGGSVLLTSSSATGNQWYLNGNPLGGETNSTYNATASGSYTVVVTANGCSSAPSSATVVTVNPIPATPAITPGGPTTFCAGGSVLLTSDSASGNQWYLDGSPLGGAVNATYSATASGSYTVVVTANGCPSAPSNAIAVTVNPNPATPTISPGGPTTFCEGGSVTLSSSSATGNQWYRDGVPLGGETGQTIIASTSGAYTVRVTSSGCTSPASAVSLVTVNPKPDATITTASPIFSGASSTASVAVSCVGATFFWSITGGTITAGQGTPNITFTAGAVGTLTLTITVTNSFGCTDTKSANVTVQLAPFGAPPNLRATASGTFANLSWAAVQSADHYEIYRSGDNVNFTLRGTSSTTTFADSGLLASTGYIYRVRAVQADATPSAFSAKDFAVTRTFTADPIPACPTIIRAAHILQLRDFINSARAAVGLGAFSFTDPALAPGALIKAVHLSELRTALAPALTAIGVTPAYTDPAITPGVTAVKAAHVNELRDLVR